MEKGVDGTCITRGKGKTGILNSGRKSRTDFEEGANERAILKWM
jgi:hypothetical protein